MKASILTIEGQNYEVPAQVADHVARLSQDNARLLKVLQDNEQFQTPEAIEEILKEDKKKAGK